MFERCSSLKEELMFGLVADEVFYLKVGQETTPDYEELGLGPFVYGKKERRWRWFINNQQKTSWIRNLIYVDGL